MHVYDGRYPVAPTTVLRPPDASVDDYRELQTRLGLDRVVVVQPTTYGLDNRCQLAALRSFGDSARGVMVVDDETSPEELHRLTELGVRGARFHMLAGGAVGWDALEPTAAAIARYGWHVQLQLNGLELADRVEQLLRLPVPLVVDHIGRFMPPGGIEHTGFVALLRLVGEGRAWVKLSAPYESSSVADDVLPLVDELVARHPDRLVWATNWPHPGPTDPPSSATLEAWLDRWLPDVEVRRRVLVDNPAQLYEF
ncbi:MAG: amidohydrolase family protein [Actinomycetota bacterium]